MILTWSVSPLLIWIVYSLAKDKSGTSIFLSSLNSDGVVAVFCASNVARLGVECEDFFFRILRLANHNLILVTSKTLTPSKNSLFSHF